MTSPVAQDEGPLHHVPQLADVPGPGVLPQPLERARRPTPARGRPASAASRSAKWRARTGTSSSRSDERRDVDGEDRQPEVEVLAEAPRRAPRRGGPGGWRRGPARRPRSRRAPPARRTRRSSSTPEELPLHARAAGRATSSRSSVPPLGHLEQPGAPLAGPGEGAPLVPEELGLDERRRDGRAVHRQEGPVPPRRRARGPSRPTTSLPGPARPLDDHARRGQRHPPHQLEERRGWPARPPGGSAPGRPRPAGRAAAPPPAARPAAARARSSTSRRRVAARGFSMKS